MLQSIIQYSIKRTPPCCWEMPRRHVMLSSSKLKRPMAYSSHKSDSLSGLLIFVYSKHHVHACYACAIFIMSTLYIILILERFYKSCYNNMCTEPGLPPVCKVYVLLRHACAARATNEFGQWPYLHLQSSVFFVIFSVVVCEGYNHSTSTPCTHSDIAVPLLIGSKLYNMG